MDAASAAPDGNPEGTARAAATPARGVRPARGNFEAEGHGCTRLLCPFATRSSRYLGHAQ
eukprot:8994654-Pyramimonas_sp.AAC.1